MRVVPSPGGAHAGSGLPDCRAAREAQLANLLTVLKQKKKSKKKQAKPTELAQSLVGDTGHMCLVELPAKREGLPLVLSPVPHGNPGLVPVHRSSPRARECGERAGHTPGHQTKQNRLKTLQNKMG